MIGWMYGQDHGKIRLSLTLLSLTLLGCQLHSLLSLITLLSQRIELHDAPYLEEVQSKFNAWRDFPMTVGVLFMTVHFK